MPQAAFHTVVILFSNKGRHRGTTRCLVGTSGGSKTVSLGIDMHALFKE